jgi:hypothetical protein
MSPVLTPDDDYRAERVVRYAQAEREARRDTRREMLRVMGMIAFWVACGLLLIGMALHVTDHAIGMAFWWAGHAVWIGGVASAIHTAYRRGEARGDW